MASVTFWLSVIEKVVVLSTQESGSNLICPEKRKLQSTTRMVLKRVSIPQPKFTMHLMLYEPGAEKRCKGKSEDEVLAVPLSGSSKFHLIEFT